MTVRVCTCCRTAHTALHAHDRPCDIHSLALVVPLPIPLHLPGGEDCTGPTVTAAILSAYRLQGGVALELALAVYARPTPGTAPEWDGRCRACYLGEPHNAAQHDAAVRQYLDTEREVHQAAAGAKCHMDTDGFCLTCGVEMTLCNVCKGIGYHREGCTWEATATGNG